MIEVEVSATSWSLV